MLGLTRKYMVACMVMRSAALNASVEFAVKHLQNMCAPVQGLACFPLSQLNSST